MNLKAVGFYKEMPHGMESQLSLKDYIQKEKEDINKISDYLLSGVEIIVSPGTVNDLLDESKGIAGTTSLFTDGEWLWSGDLAYYVREYRLKLPEEFINTMRKNAWKINVSIEDLDLKTLSIDDKEIY